MAEVGSKRRRFVRNPDRVDDIVLAAMERLRKDKNENAFRAGISEVVEAIDKRVKVQPSRASIYRSIERLAEQGHFRITRKGERGNYTYSFSGTSVTAPATPLPRVTNDEPSGTTTGDPVTVLKSLDEQIDSLMNQLRVRVEQKRAQVAALEALLREEERELVAV
jgi:hypothetical protein